MQAGGQGFNSPYLQVEKLERKIKKKFKLRNQWKR